MTAMPPPSYAEWPDSQGPALRILEKLGWTESQVVIRFWIIAVMLALIGLSTLKLR